MLKAARTGDLALVDQYLREFPEAINDTANSSGVTALHVAARFGKHKVAEMLLERGAAVDQKAPEGFTALHAAALHGMKKVVVVLLSKGARVNVVAKGSTPLLLAKQGHEELVALLTSFGAV